MSSGVRKLGAREGSGGLNATPKRWGTAMQCPCAAHSATCWSKWQIGQFGLALHS